MCTIRSTIFSIVVSWDTEAGVWSGACDAIPASAEAKTLDGLLAEISAMTADLLFDNHPELDLASVHFQITAMRRMEPVAA